MFKESFSEHQKFLGPQEGFGGNCPRITPRVCEPGQNRRQKSSIGGLHVCAEWLDILNIYFQFTT